MSIKVALLGTGVDKSLIPHLFVLDQNVPLDQVIKAVCKVWNIDATRALECALKDEDRGVYITQDNRTMLSDGSVLVLSKAPGIAAKEQLEKLTLRAEMGESLKSLRYETKDATFAQTFINLNGLEELTKVIGIYKADPGERENLGYALRSYAQLLMHKDAVSEALTGMSKRTKFVEDLIPLTREGGIKQDSMQKWIIHSVLEIAGILVLHSPTGFEVINVKLTLEAIVKHIESMTAGTTQPPDIQEAAVKLINCMITACPTTMRQGLFKELNRLRVRNKLMPRVIKGCEGGAVPPSFAHELYVLQTNFVSEEQGDVASAKPTWDRQRVDWLGLITRLGTARTGSAADTPEKLELLGFPDPSSAQTAFNVYPHAVGLECIHFLAGNYPEIYKDLFEKMADRPVEYRCPFVAAGQLITKLLLKILDVVPGSKPDDKCTSYLPLYFTTPKAFHELFCVAMRVMATTWIDMEAKVIDTEKVLLVVEKQVRSVLDHPEKKIKPDIHEFQSAVMKYKYINVLQSEQEAMLEDFAAQMASPVVVSVKDTISPEMFQLVNKQRLAHMSQGAFFYTIEKGKITTKRFYAVLAPNQKTLHWSDSKDEFQVGNSDMRPTIAQLKSGEGGGQVNIEDIHMFEVTEDVAELKTVRSKPNEEDARPRTFSILTGQDTRTVFVAETRETAAVWIDGMRMLKSQPNREPETVEERTQLVKLQMDLKLLDMHGVKLPKVKPVVPKLPPNFDFHYKEISSSSSSSSLA